MTRKSKFHVAAMLGALGVLGLAMKAHSQVFPSTLLVCEDKACDNGTGASLFSFKGDTGVEVGNGNSNLVRINRFDVAGISIRRLDGPSPPTGGAAPNTVFVGRVNGYSAGGTMTRHDSAGHVKSSGAWRGVILPTSCDRDGDSGQAKASGARARYLSQDSLALKCYLIAARRGDPEAETAVGLLLHEGLGTEHDQAAAFSWLKKAADANDYQGEIALSNMYRLGQAGPADSTKAAYWFHKADEQRSAAQAAAARKDMFEIIAVTTLAFAMMAEGASDTGSGSTSPNLTGRPGSMGTQTWDNARQHEDIRRGLLDDPGRIPPSGYKESDPYSH